MTMILLTFAREPFALEQAVAAAIRSSHCGGSTKAELVTVFRCGKTLAYLLFSKVLGSKLAFLGLAWKDHAVPRHITHGKDSLRWEDAIVEDAIGEKSFQATATVSIFLQAQDLRRCLPS